MDVVSFVMMWSLIGQTSVDSLGAPSPPIPTAGAPLSARPGYGAAPANGQPMQPPPSFADRPAGAPTERYAQTQQPQAPTTPNYAAPSGYAAPNTPPINTALPSNTLPSNTLPKNSFSNNAQPGYSTPTYETVPASNNAASAPPAQNEDKSGAGDLVRESLVLPKSLALPGRTTSLDELFGYVGDRRRQIDAVRTYWKLTADVADYHFAWQQTQFLKLLSEVIDSVEKGPDLQRAKTETTSRYAEAQARRREAELRLAATQHELADRASLPTANRQPLPRDLPHVGVYNTHFEKVYAQRTPPARAYLLNRTLPLWREIIAMRAETVWASQDAYDAAFDAYRKGQLEVDDVFIAVEELRERRSEFIGAVRRYNEEIAEYALTSAPDGTSRETLVGMLIKNSHTPKLGRAIVPNSGGEIEQVTYVDEFGNTISAEAFSNSEPAARATELPAAEPTLLPPQAATKPSTINLMSATLPIANVDETSAGAPVPPARDLPVAMPQTVIPQTPIPQALPTVGVPPSFFQPVPAAMPMPGPPSPFPNSGAAAPVRGEPTLAPPQKPAGDAPLKFKVNRLPTEDFDAQRAPRQLPDYVQHEAQPLNPQSPYSSGTHPKKKPKPENTAGAPAATAPLLSEPRTGTLIGAESTALESIKASPVEAKTGEMRFDPEVEPAGYYTQLTQLPAARRTQELVELLHGTRALPANQFHAATLDECMTGSEPSHRREIIQAYWRTAEYATRYRVWTQKLERLDALGQSALQFRDKPAGSIAMLQIRAAKLSVEANRLSTMADLAIAQWNLTNDARRPLDSAWIIPSTLPHAGSYKTQLEGLPAGSAKSPRLQEAAERIPVLHETMLLRADAVTSADAASDQVLQKYAAGQTTVATALNALSREARTTHDLLATVTRYNLDIAEYALAVLPGSAPRDALVGALVVNRTTARR
ncbi:MAG: hypothetical protein K8U03_11925 [Planctomycetia bacterium]|nr:hypothetical protein [Planctomycetia bacterium]